MGHQKSAAMIFSHGYGKIPLQYLKTVWQRYRKFHPLEMLELVTKIDITIYGKGYDKLSGS